MSYRSTRFCLVLVCALCIGSPAFSQSREDPAKTARLGPGAVGDCIDPAGLFSFPKPYTWRILGNSLYDIVVDGREVCYEKIVDLPVDILAFRNEHEKGTDICRIWTENGVYLYHEETRVLEEERAEGAISSFLSYPIVRTSAHNDPWGWFSERVDREHSATESSRPMLRDEERSVNDGIGAGTTMINGVRVDDLTDALRSVNRDPYRIPSLADFEIGDDAIDRFREEVDAWSLYYRVKEAGDKETEPSFLERDQPILTPSERYLPIYRALPDMIERVASNVVIDALNDQVFILFPQELQRQGYVSCLDLGDQLLAANPAHAEALTIRALAQTSLGAESADVQSDLIASQLAAPQLTWLADRRLSFVLSQPATEDWAALIESEALILLGSSIGLRRLAQIYANRPEHRAVLQASVELTSERVQRRFINRVRHALQESS